MDLQLISIIVGLALLGVGSAALGLCLVKVSKRFDDPEEEVYKWEQYTASDGHKYWWPVDRERSSRDKKSA